MQATRTSTPTRPVIRDLAAGRIDDDGLVLGGRDANALAERGMHFALDGDGPLSERELVPLSDGARRLLDAPEGARFREILLGSLAPFDAERAVGIAGFTFARDRPTYALNLALSDIAARQWPSTDPWLVRDSGGATTFDELAEHRLRQVSSDYAIIGRYVQPPGGWLDLGPDVTRQLLAAARDGRTARSAETQRVQAVLAHEIEHAVQPPPATGYGRWEWLEEGTAEVLALAQPAADARARSSRIPRRRITDLRTEWMGDTDYRTWHDQVTSLLRLGGIDPDTRSGYARARAVLQGTPIERVPAQLARSIADHHDLSSAEQGRVTRAITAIGTGERTVEDVAGIVRDAAND